MWAAEPRYLMMWPCIFQRMWVLLPMQPPAHNTPHGHGAIGDSAMSVCEAGGEAKRSEPRDTQAGRAATSSRLPGEAVMMTNNNNTIMTPTKERSIMSPPPTRLTALSPVSRGDHKSGEVSRARVSDDHGVPHRADSMPERVAQLTEKVCRAVHTTMCKDSSRVECVTGSALARYTPSAVVTTCDRDGAAVATMMNEEEKLWMGGTTRHLRRREWQRYCAWCETLAWHRAMAGVGGQGCMDHVDDADTALVTHSRAT